MPTPNDKQKFALWVQPETLKKVDLIGKRENYVGYIAMRPHVEKTGAHGLFTDSDVPIHLSAVAKEVAEHPGVVFTEVLSLRREDAARLGYDKGAAWRDLLRSQTKEMAEAMKIPLTDLKWFAAFHNESHHPHVHIVAYSTGKEPYMTEQGLKKLKSSFAREIFKQDLLQVYDRQTEHRNALARESRDLLSEIVERINTGGYDNETVELMLKELSDTLSRTKGKKVYGYLPQRAKNLVNGIVDELAKDSRIAALYDLWYEQREEVIRTYTDAMPERIPLSRNKEFKSVRNAVIQEAMELLGNKIEDAREVLQEYPMAAELPTSSTDQGNPYTRYVPKHDRTEIDRAPAGLAALRLFAYLSQTIWNDLRWEENGPRHVEKKLRRKIAEKQELHGQHMG